MNDKNKDPLFIEAEKYLNFYKEDIENIDNIIKNIDNLQAIVNEEINKIKEAVPGRGTQKYLIDHISNAISLYTEKQSLVKDKRSIKETSLSLAMKNNSQEATDSAEILTQLSLMIKEKQRENKKSLEKSEKKIEELSEKIIDDEIEKRLQEIE